MDHLHKRVSKWRRPRVWVCRIAIAGFKRLIKLFRNPLNFKDPCGRAEYIKTGFALFLLLGAILLPLIITATLEIEILTPAIHDIVGYSILFFVFIYSPLCLLSLTFRRIRSTTSSRIYLYIAELLWIAPYLTTNYLRSIGSDVPNGLTYSLIAATAVNILYASIAP